MAHKKSSSSNNNNERREHNTHTHTLTKKHANKNIHFDYNNIVAGRLHRCKRNVFVWDLLRLLLSSSSFIIVFARVLLIISGWFFSNAWLAWCVRKCAKNETHARARITLKAKSKSKSKSNRDHEHEWGAKIYHQIVWEKIKTTNQNTDRTREKKKKKKTKRDVM